MKRFAALLLILCVLLSACGKKSLSWQEYCDLGVQELNAGRYTDAISAFSSAISMEPTRDEAYVLRGDAYMMAALELITNHPVSYSTDNILSMAHLLIENTLLTPEQTQLVLQYLDGAEEDYRKAQELNPETESSVDQKLAAIPLVEEIIPDVTVTDIDTNDAVSGVTIPAEEETDASTPGEESAGEETEALNNILECSFFKVAVPDSWEGRYLFDVVEHATVDGFCDYVSMTFYEAEENALTGQGTLFSIVLLPDSQEIPYPDYDFLGALRYGELRYHVCAVYPTDVQCSEQTAANYFALCEDINTVLWSLEAQTGCSFDPVA